MSEEGNAPEGEVWKSVVRWEGIYAVSSAGRLKSHDKIVRCKGNKTRIHRGRILSLSRATNGYPSASLQDARTGRKEPVLMHRLVLEAFRGPCPDGYEACHNDGNALNNRLDNLRWDTRQANSDDKDRHGTRRLGSQTDSAKLVESDIADIRIMCDSGMKLKDIASKFGVSINAIWCVYVGKTWIHVPGHEARLNPREKVIKALESEPDLKCSELADRLNRRADCLYKLLRSMRADGQITMSTVVRNGWRVV